MKISQFLSLFFIAFTVFSFTACGSSRDDDNPQDTAPGKLQIKFENGFNNVGDIVLNQTVQTSSNGQKHNFSALKYIISNISLIDENGNEFKYNENNPDKGAFIVDQADAVAGIIYLNLDGIPKNNYKTIKFGLGISQKAYLLGQDGQAEFWTKAKQKGMSWSWAAGYVFVKLEGKYATDAPYKEFMNHTGNMGNTTENNTPDLYREITLNFPTTARVTGKIRPSVHILADLNQFLSGNKPLTLTTANDMLMGSNQHLVDVTNNLTMMFKVDHVHND
ncbi:MbnP family protein [Chryseobacterium flavum]|uniref:MbnP family protein n=1 Tax=Chryseobacterium flavum TaxID=415851 RepID=UPI0028A895B7|nr:MbnP family protein [Chryseobacterium flavum]